MPVTQKRIPMQQWQAPAIRPGTNFMVGMEQYQPRQNTTPLVNDRSPVDGPRITQQPVQQPQQPSTPFSLPQVTPYNPQITQTPQQNPQTPVQNEPWWMNLPGQREAQQQAQQEQQARSGQIQTSITPSGIYTPLQTRAATNQAVAAQHAQGDPYWQMKQFDRPGIGRGAQTGALALPGIMAGKLGAANAAAMLPFEDQQANLQHLLAGQVAREGEALDWGNLLARLEETQSRLRTSGIQPGLSLLQALLG